MSTAQASGKTILVTGATSGIGLETARALGKMGYRVVVGSRDSVRGQAVVDEIKTAGGVAELLSIDLASFASVRRAAETFGRSHSELDVLINNAGLVASKRQVTADQHELTWQTNFLSAFLLTRLLMTKLKSASKPRVINVSSDAHNSGRIHWDDLELSNGYRGLKAYAQSKLALVLFTRELAKREPGVVTNALHPGVIGTNIWNAAPKVIASIFKLVLPSSEKGARPVVRLATASELEGISGHYFKVFADVPPAPPALSEVDAARLWEIAEKATA